MSCALSRLATRIRQVGRSLPAAMLVLGFCAPASAEETAFRLYVERDGVYRVSFSELVRAGLAQRTHAPEAIALRQGGRDVPLWIEAGDDGTFGEGDWLEFIGRHLEGEGSYFNHHARQNVYQLGFESQGGARMTSVALAAKPAPSRQPAAFLQPADARQPALLDRLAHAEVDRLLIRLSHEEVARETAEPAQLDLWYWHKLTHIDEQPVQLELDLPGLDRASSRPVVWSAHVRGLSEPAEKAGNYPDHQLAVAVNGIAGEPASWDGRSAMTLDLPPLEAARLSGRGDVVSLTVPRRTPPGEKHPVVDVVMLNWIKARYGWDGRVLEPVHFHTTPSESSAEVRLSAPNATNIRVYGELGSRIEPRRDRERLGGSGAAPRQPQFTFPPQPGESAYWAVPDGRLAAVERIEADGPSNLRGSNRQADYLILGHATLLDAVRPLARFHRGNGLAVEVIDVQDVYDEFNHGIQHPRALRRFVSHAYHQWQEPAPRYVLLVGDASWDIHNEVPDDANYANWVDRALVQGTDSFRPRKFDAYPDSGASTDRALVPTGQTFTYQGQAASDNYFVAVDGDDYVPDLAIGRFPVVEPQAVSDIVDKILGYAGSELGPWRRRALLIANEWIAYQMRSDSVARTIAPVGFSSVKVYPSGEAATGELHQQRLLEAFDQGQLFVHFVGHGGRFIWRTGATEGRKSQDLFTLDHLDQLQPNRKLPVVLSVTCHSGPFDHPVADSIAEKFLRLPGRGAIAVVAASWRSNPGGPLSPIFAEAFSRRATVGEAFLEVKRRMNDRMLVEGYNLFGDPALALAVPQGRLELRSAGRPESPTAEIRLPIAEFDGRITIDWHDADGTVLSREEHELTTTAFSTPIPLDPAIRFVAAYAWDRGAGWDASGGMPVAPPAAGASGAAP